MSKWISVEDSLPPDYQEVLFFATTSNGMSHELMTGHRETGFWHHCCLFYSSMPLSPTEVVVSHWMELPDYPRTKDE